MPSRPRWCCSSCKTGCRRRPPWSRPFLGLYFVSAALSLPLWMRAGAPLRPGAHLAAGIVLAVAAFAWAATLGAGDASPVPGGLRPVGHGAGHRPGSARRAAGRRDRRQRRPRPAPKARTSAGGTSPPSSTSRWRPAWPCPCWALAGYTPGARDPQALQALTLAYCALPCALKLLAAGALMCW